VIKLNDFLVFDIYGMKAFWKKFYSNSSSLTYFFPTRTNLTGLVSAILANDYFENMEKYNEDFTLEKAKFGIKTFSKFRTRVDVINQHMSPKIDDQSITQINKEYLLDKNEGRVHYRVYFTHENKELLDILEDKLKRKDPGFTICLGARDCLANMEFIKKVSANNVEKLSEYSGEINTSLINDENIVQVDTKNKKNEVMPMVLNPERECLETGTVVYKDDTLEGVFENIYKLDEEYVSTYQ